MPTRPSRPVTFRCEECSLVVTEDRPPGPVPHYCRACYPIAQRAMNAARTKRWRERTQPRTGWERPRGRPKKG